MDKFTTGILKSLTDKELQSLKKRVGKEINSRKYLRGLDKPVKSNGSKSGGRKRKFNIYVLVCTEGKYYVGLTAQKVEKRFQQHVEGKGAKWTKRHKPIGIQESYPIGFMSESEATKYESEKTHQLIEQYGASNVRGGDLCYLDQKTVDGRIEKSIKALSKIKARADANRALEQDVYQESLAQELRSMGIA